MSTEKIYFDNIQIGDEYQHNLGRTVTQTDEAWFTLLTTSTNQLHFNSDYALKTEFKTSAVNAPFSLALLTGLVLNDFAEATIHLRWKKIRAINPLFVGETLYATSTIIDKRDCDPIGNSGIAEIFTTGRTDSQKKVLEFYGHYLIPKRIKQEDLCIKNKVGPDGITKIL